MSDSATKSNARRPVEILTRQIQERWFRLMKQWLIGEGLWDVVDPDNASDPPVFSRDGPIFPTTAAKAVESPAYGKNQEFNETNKKLDARAQYQLGNCINDDDGEMVAEETRSRGIWNRLIKKYKKTLKTVGRQYLADLVNYKKSPDMDIEAAYTEITKMSRKVVELQPEMKAMALPTGRFQILLKSLPEDYDTLRDAIDGQKDPDLEDSFQRLQEKEAQLKAKDKEAAMWAKDNNRKGGHNRGRAAQRRPRPRRSTSSSGSERGPHRDRRHDKSKSKKDGCFLCDGPHRIAACPLLRDLRKMAKSLVEKGDRKDSSKKSKHKAYNANDSSSTSSAESVDIDSDNEEDMLEIAALSKELVSTIPKSDWIADTGATSHMTDQLRLFSGPLKSIKRRTIKVGGGKLCSDQCGTVVMKVNGECRLTEVLYVPDLGVNLLSGRRFTRCGLRGSFDNDGLYIHTKEGIEVLRAPARGGIYIVDKVASLDEFALAAVTASNSEPASFVSAALPAATIPDESMSDSEPQELNVDSDPAVIQALSTSKKRDMFNLWHRRLNHLGSAKLRHLHKVTTIKKPIPIVESTDPCEVCAITKMTNKRNRTLAERRPRILALISIDICGPLPTSRLGYEYFLEIIDNYSRRTWVIPLRERSDAPAALDKWKLRAELQCSAKLQAVRSDNATELKSTLDAWCTSIGIEPEYTVAYNSNQNGVAERGIRTTENQIRAMLQDAGLPLEFWPEAANADAHVRNRVATGPIIKGELTTPMEAFTNIKPSIDHLRVWGCKCYSPVDTKSLPDGSRTDKLVNRGRPGVFMGYDENTTSHYYIWAPDRQDVIKHHKVTFLENQKWGSAPLNLKVATANVLPERRPVGRPRKVAAAASGAIVSPVIAIGAEPVIAGSTEPAPEPTPKMATPNAPSKKRPVGRPRKVVAAVPGAVVPPVIAVDNPIPNPVIAVDAEPMVAGSAESASVNTNTLTPKEQVPYIEDPYDPEEVNELTAESTVQTRAKLASLTSPPRTAQQFLHVATKRKRHDSTDEEERDEHRDKIVRAMLAFLAHESDGNENKEWALTAASDKADKQFVHRLVIPVPESYEAAIKDPLWGKLWLEAVQAELTALIANGTWDVAVPPKGANIITSKWVFKAKMHVDGTLEKLKARIVARGFSQLYGVDFTDTFAPTVKFDTLRLFLVIVCLEDLECHQVDVNNAFTESFLKEVIYMAPPPGVDLPPGQALLIRRSLYGLKQAARDWHERCVRELVRLGFEQCAADPCMLRHKERGIILLVYVDDICVAAKALSQVQWFKDEFQKAFKIKDLGEMKKILGIRITRNRKKRTLRMDQSHYLSEFLDELHMSTDKHEKTKIPMNGYDALRPAGPNDRRISPKDYQHKIGKLMYAAMHTRPDFCFALGRLSQYLGDPAHHHGQALKTLLRYIRSTIDLGIEYGPPESSGSSLKAYSDSDYAADRLNRKSILGYVYMFAGGPVAWMSRKQKSVATSTTEAEYMALSTCVKEGLWIAQVLRDLGLSKYLRTELGQVAIAENVKHKACSPMQLYGDNQAANLLVKDAHISERSKHIDVSYHHVRDTFNKNLIELNYIPTDDMVADGLTKPLTGDKYKNFVDLMGLQKPGVSGSRLTHTG